MRTINKVSKEVRACVHDETKFAKRVKALAAGMVKNQLEIGKLVHLYIEEHGNRYGDKIYRHIAEITEVAVESIRNFHDFYWLQTAYPNCTNLGNLGKSIQYQIARLRKHPAAKELIPQLAKKAVETNMRTVDVESEVAAMLNDVKRLNRKPKVKKPAPTNPGLNGQDEQTERTFGSEDEEPLWQATAALDLANHQNTKLSVNMADHMRVVAEMCRGLVGHIQRLVELGEALTLEPIVNRMAKELATLQQQLAKHEAPQCTAERKVA